MCFKTIYELEVIMFNSLNEKLPFSKEIKIAYDEALKYIISKSKLNSHGKVSSINYDYKLKANLYDFTDERDNIIKFVIVFENDNKYFYVLDEYNSYFSIRSGLWKFKSED